MMKPARSLTFGMFGGLGALMAVALSGCGGRGDVWGTVRLNGTPLSAGRVTFVSKDNPSSVVYSGIAQDGSYRIFGCPAGPVQVAVQTVVPRSGGGRPGGPTIPLRYVDPATSGLDYTVARGQHQHDIDLQPDVSLPPRGR
jgi:hypothetical protein